MIENWTVRNRPARLERRIEFDNYELTREFLELTAEFSEKEGCYPDMNFGRTHVSMTIHGNTEDGLDESQLRFARKINEFAPGNKISSPLTTEYVTDRS